MNTHMSYECSVSFGSKIMENVNFFEKKVDSSDQRLRIEPLGTQKNVLHKEHITVV